MTAPISILPLLQQTHAASASFRRLSDAQKAEFLVALADEILAQKVAILEANAKDIALMDSNNPMIDRLLLTDKRIEALSESTRSVAL